MAPENDQIPGFSNIPPGPEGGGDEGGGGGTDLGGGQASAGRLEGMALRGMVGRTPRRGPRSRQEVAWEARELVWKARHGAHVTPGRGSAVPLHSYPRRGLTWYIIGIPQFLETQNSRSRGM